MANETRKTKKKSYRSIALLIAIAILIGTMFTGCTDQQVEDGIGIVFDIIIEMLGGDSETEPEGTGGTESPKPVVPVEGEMEVHFIDVGQADSTLIICGDKVMLFDAATYNRGDEIAEYLLNLGIDYIDVLVLSHPHDDHMGGVAPLLKEINVGTIYCPDIEEVMEKNTTDWYELMREAIEDRYIFNNPGSKPKEWTKIIVLPRDKDGNFASFNVGEATVQFLAPLEDSYSDKNDYSICAIVSFGEIDIMFTGDATEAVEKDLLAEGYNLDVEIYHAAHHGSKTSNSREFLEAMSPESIVISCGMKNTYRHPNEPIIELFKELGIPVYRTDESGSIVMTTDGESYSFSVDPGTYTSGEEYKDGK